MSTSSLVNDFLGRDPSDCPRCDLDSCDGTCGSTGSTGSGGSTPSSRTGTALISYSLAGLRNAAFPRRHAILMRGDVPVFRSGDLGEVYAMRGVGKTWFVTTLALVVAGGVEALGFRAPEKRRVVVIDGEMSAEALRDRFQTLQVALGVESDAPLDIVAADWQRDPMPRLDTKQGQRAVEPIIDAAELVIVDNRSCLFDPESEKDASAWTPAQKWLLSLRRRGKAVILVHHSNRLGGARGHSKAEDILDVCIKLTRPEGYAAEQGSRFTVEWEKSRGIPPGPATAPFVATLSEFGWSTEGSSLVETDGITRKILSHLEVMETLGERPGSANAVVAGAKVNRAAGLRALASLKNQGIVSDVDGYSVVRRGSQIS